MKRIIPIFCIISLVVIAFIMGRFSVNSTPTHEPLHQPTKFVSTEPHIEQLPNAAWIIYQGPRKEAGQIGVNRTNDMEKIISISVDNDHSHLISEFFPNTGHTKSISFKNSRKYVREWTFREDGSLETETIYEKDGHKGVKTYFKEDGSKDREEGIIMHNA